MRLFLTTIWLTCKRLLRDRAFLMGLLLLPLVLLGCSWLLQRQVPITTVGAGVVFDPSDQAAVQFYNELPQLPYVSFTAFMPDDYEEVERLVRTGALECAWVLESSFSAALSSGDLQNAVTLLRSDSTVADVILNELVFATILRQCAPDLTTDMLLRVFQEDRQILYEYVTTSFDWYYTEGLDQFLQQQTEYIETSGLLQSSAGTLAQRPVHGVIALFLMAMNLFLLPRLIEDKSSGLWRRLGLGGLLRYYAGVFCALLLLTLLTALPGLLILQAMYAPALAPLHWELLTLLSYAACICALAVLLAVLLLTPDMIYAAGIFLILAVLLLGGVLFDWMELSSLMAAISRFFPTEHYITAAVRETTQGLLWLVAVCAGAWGLTALRLTVWHSRGR